MILPWKYISNQLDTETERSVQEAVTLSLYHDNALFTLSEIMPDLLSLYNRYHPLHVDFMDGFSNLSSVGGIQQGDRISVKEAFADAKEHLTDEWLPAILMLHTKKSARYKALISDGMNSFVKKGMDIRIAAYETLAKNIGDEVDLATIKDAIVNA